MMSHPSFDSPNPGCRSCLTTIVSAVTCLLVVAVGLVMLAVIS